VSGWEEKIIGRREVAKERWGKPKNLRIFFYLQLPTNYVINRRGWNNNLPHLYFCTPICLLGSLKKKKGSKYFLLLRFLRLVTTLKMNYQQLNHIFVHDLGNTGRKPRVNVINILRAAFMCTDPKSAKRLTHFLLFWDLRVQKLLAECWWNWHLGSILWIQKRTFGICTRKS